MIGMPLGRALGLGLECILMSRMPLGCPLGLGLSTAPSGIPSKALEVDGIGLPGRRRL